MSLSVHPVLKWTGSKRRLVPAIHALAPRCYRVYREPFLGSGVVFFNVTSRAPAVLSDCLPEVMAIHQAVKDQPLEMLRQVYEHLENLRRIGPRYYYTVRDAFNQTRDPAALVFLTRTSYWGLVRFNEAGEFNVAFHAGRFPRLNGLKRHVLAQSHLLQRATLLATDYGEALADATEGDWVYLDPPYPGNGQMYGSSGQFDYGRLAGALSDLSRKGCQVLLSFAWDKRRGSEMVASSANLVMQFAQALSAHTIAVVLVGNYGIWHTERRKMVIRECMVANYDFGAVPGLVESILVG